MRRPVRDCSIIVLWTFAGLGLGLAACGTPRPGPAAAGVVDAIDASVTEAMPASRLATMAARDQALAAAQLEDDGDSPMRLQRKTRRWAAGATIRVAIRGGDSRLHRQIAEVAALWSVHANIGFDFGDVGGRDFRTWSPNDTAYTAQIRLGFEAPGHFSCIGDESVNAACAAPGQASMNFGGFDRRLPADWRGIVLHQFGHALGLEHERPSADDGCDAELRWEDDAGYVSTRDPAGRLAPDGAGRWPGIYTVLAGPPFGWDRGRVDQALRRSEPRAAGHGAPDPLSVMRGHVAEWMLRAHRASRCYAPRAERLSEADERAIAAMYPRVPADVLAAVRQHEAALASIRDADRLAPPLRRFVQGRLEVLEAVRLSRPPR